MMLSVFTPTYNRAHLLPRLYRSLLEQEIPLVWIVVDDGSEDETPELVARWQRERLIPIRYLRQGNSGKMAAHNVGIRVCDTELFLCVDSDDYLVEGSLAKALAVWESCRDLTHICGMAGYRQMVNRSGSLIPHKRFGSAGAVSLPDLLYGYRGETALFFRTDILREYPFPIYAGEKYIPEDYVYNRIGDRYGIMVLEEDIIYCRYERDGYTRNWHSHLVENPRGSALCFHDRIWRHRRLTPRHIADTVRYLALERVRGIRACTAVRTTPYPLLSRMLFPVAAGWLFMIKRCCRK